MKPIIKIAFVCSSLLLSSNVALAQVSKISSENLVQIGRDAYWSADVTCKDDSVRKVQRKTDGAQWCGKDIDGFCETSKDAAAKKVCGEEYSSELDSLESARITQENAAKEAAAKAEASANAKREEQRRLADQRIKQQQAAAKAQQAAAAPLKKKISIEEQLILIEQEKLNLRRQELELQKRAVEIEKLLEKTN